MMKFFVSLVLLVLMGLSLQTYAQEHKKIEIGYMPNLWWAQPFVIKGMGWDKEMGIDLTLAKYPGPPTQIQAFAAGKLDMGYNNIGSTLALPQQGIEISVIASSIKGDIFLAGRGRLMELRKTLSPGEAVKALAAEEGRKVVMSTNPKGTLSDLVLRYWLKEALGDYEQYVHVVNTGSQDQFQHSIISGDVDAAAVFQPLWTVSKYRAPELEIFAEPYELMADQPGGVLYVRQSFLDENPDVVKKYLALHIRATRFMKANPQKASQHIHHYVTRGLVPLAITKEAVAFTTNRFAEDPRVMVAPTKVIQEQMVQDGYLKTGVDIDGLYQTDLYEGLIEKESF